MRRRDRYEVPYDLRDSGQPEVEGTHLTDERKLFYVGATRAKELLILETADIVNKRGGGPSPFLQLAYFLQCPVRYELAVVYGLEPLRSDPADFGANVHRALLSIHDRALVGANLTDSDIAEIVEDSWLSPVSGADGSASAQERDAKEAAVKQLRRYVREYTSDLGRVEKAELSFSFRLEESVLLGRIDLIRKEKGGIEVVDFKTSESSKERVEQEQVETQLDIYALYRVPIDLHVHREETNEKLRPASSRRYCQVRRPARRSHLYKPLPYIAFSAVSWTTSGSPGGLGLSSHPPSLISSCLPTSYLSRSMDRTASSMTSGCARGR